LDGTDLQLFQEKLITFLLGEGLPTPPNTDRKVSGLGYSYGGLELVLKQPLLLTQLNQMLAIADALPPEMMISSGP
jgi:hypothetical protein